jgi:hypothetical protein
VQIIVQIFKPDPDLGGILKFGTELAAAQDRYGISLIGEDFTRRIRVATAPVLNIEQV